MRQVFLYSDLTDTFEENSRPFVVAAGGGSARIAFGMSGAPGWERHLPRYRDPWLHLGAAEVVPLVPVGGVLPAEALAELARCTGVFIGGGDTRVYRALYAQGEAAAIIRRRHAEGIPYAGLSAGALIAPEVATVWGDQFTTRTNTVQLRGADDGCGAELETGSGLGLIGGLLVEPHFSERGGFPRLVAAMERTKVRVGVGLDDSICVEVRDGRLLHVCGRGRAYLLVQRRSAGFSLRVLEPGSEVTVSE